jgi:predicted restriction endonuclease
VTGRPAKGVYDKLLNFRALDPRDERAGLAGYNRTVDVPVWEKYYDSDSRELRSEQLDMDFHSIWKPSLIEPTEPPASPPKGRANPPRSSTTTITRIVRDSAVTRRVKDLYDHACQACGARLCVDGKPYAEGAHITPLGGGHGGLDEASNMICLCPNHHVLFDRGGFTVDPDYTLRDVSSCGVSGKLIVLEHHRIRQEHFTYHRDVIAVSGEHD